MPDDALTGSKELCRFLNLPQELLVDEVLRYLFVRPLLLLRQTCRTLKALIDGSPQLQYQMELEIAGMADQTRRSYQHYPISTRLQLLKEHEERWKQLAPQWRRAIHFPISARSWFLVTESALILMRNEHTQWKNGEPFDASLLSCRLPSNAEEPFEWGEIYFDDAVEVCGFGSSVRLFDLCAVLMRSKWRPEIQMTRSVDIHLLQHSTFQPHPLASVPLIKLKFELPGPAEDYETPRVRYVGFCDDVLTTFLTIPSKREPTYVTYIFSWNWQTGQERSSSVIPNSIGLLHKPVWLENPRDVFLWPCDGALGLFHLPLPGTGIGSVPGGLVPLEPILLLAFPDIKSNKQMVFVDADSYCAIYSCTVPFTSTDVPPFMHDVRRAVVFVTIDYLPINELSPAYDYPTDRARTFTVVLHHPSLIQICRPFVDRFRSEAKSRKECTSFTFSSSSSASSSPTPSSCPRILWEAWGPPISRWFDFPNWVSSCGERMVLTRRPEGTDSTDGWMDEEPQRYDWVEGLEIYDFSQLRVARDRATFGHLLSKSSGSETKDGGDKPELGFKLEFMTREEPTVIRGSPDDDSDDDSDNLDDFAPSTPPWSPFVTDVYSHLPFALRKFKGQMPQTANGEDTGVSWTWMPELSIGEEDIIAIEKEYTDDNEMVVVAFHSLHFG